MRAWRFCTGAAFIGDKQRTTPSGPRAPTSQTVSRASRDERGVSASNLARLLTNRGVSASKHPRLLTNRGVSASKHPRLLTNGGVLVSCFTRLLTNGGVLVNPSIELKFNTGNKGLMDSYF